MLENHLKEPHAIKNWNCGSSLVRTLMGGFLLMDAVNAVSYFFRTGGFGTLLGYEPMPTEASFQQQSDQLSRSPEPSPFALGASIDCQ